MSSYLPLLLLIAGPLMMVFMMRGRHGGRSGDAGGGDSLAKLRRRREARKGLRTPAGGGWR